MEIFCFIYGINKENLFTTRLRIFMFKKKRGVVKNARERERAREGERECDGEEGEESSASRSRRKECSFTVESKAFEIVVEDRRGKIQGLIVEKKGGVSSWVRLGSDSLGFFLEGLNLCIKDEKEDRWEGNGRSRGDCIL